MTSGNIPVISGLLFTRRKIEVTAKLSAFFLSRPLLGDLAVGRDNNFNLIRFLAATLVIFFHSLALSRIPGSIEPVYWISGGRFDSGSLGVCVFFTTSGFLVTQSLINRGLRLPTFLAARALRIFPGLIVAVLFSIGIAGVSSAVPWVPFLLDHQTKKFFVHNCLLNNIQFVLPGAFKTNPHTAVNGSLWTMPTEIRMYCFCAVTGLVGIVSSREIFNAVLLTFTVIATTTDLAANSLLLGSDSLRWAIAFLIGMALYINRFHIPLNPVAALLGIGLIHYAPRSFEHSPLDLVFMELAVAYALLVVAYYPPLFFKPFTRMGDYSYGLYIYAFPLQQYFVFSFPKLNSMQQFFAVFPVILGTAVLSWHFVEKPALRLKDRFGTFQTSPVQARIFETVAPG
jgi:peptidoglycan/LPS O-acetylase OafA/YrhL